jgi:hypothetical protein
MGEVGRPMTIEQSVLGKYQAGTNRSRLRKKEGCKMVWHEVGELFKCAYIVGKYAFTIEKVLRDGDGEYVVYLAAPDTDPEEFTNFGAAMRWIAIQVARRDANER